MTENDLHAYRQAKAAYDAAWERLREFEAAVYAPGIANYTGIVSDGSGDVLGKVAAIVDKHDALREEVRKAGERVVFAWETVDAACTSLSDSERQYVFARYIKGYAGANLAHELNYSPTQIRRIHRAIREKIRSAKKMAPHDPHMTPT